MTPTFRVLNPDGSEPDLAEIAYREEWYGCWCAAGHSSMDDDIKAAGDA